MSAEPKDPYKDFADAVDALDAELEIRVVNAFIGFCVLGLLTCILGGIIAVLMNV